MNRKLLISGGFILLGLIVVGILLWWFLLRDNKDDDKKFKLLFLPVETYTPSVSSELIVDQNSEIYKDQIIIESIDFKPISEGSTILTLWNQDGTNNEVDVDNDYEQGVFQLKIKVPTTLCQSDDDVECHERSGEFIPSEQDYQYTKGHSLGFNEMNMTQDGDAKIYEATYNLNSSYDTVSDKHIKVRFAIYPAETDEGT